MGIVGARVQENPGFGDQISIETPEQVALVLPIASIGSRLLALFLDTVVQFATIMVLVVCLVLLIVAVPSIGHTHAPRHNAHAPGSAVWGIAIVLFLQFLLLWGYFTLFEAFWNGQTPGKHWAKIRVVKETGRRVTLFESLTRNLLRAIDLLPGMYLVGGVTMLCNKSSQRLGDLVAGTLVVHTGKPLQQGVFASASLGLYPAAHAPQFAQERRPNLPASVVLPADAVARLSGEDLRTIDHFFERLLDFDLPVRAVMAERLAAHIGLKSRCPIPPGVTPENYLEAMAQAVRNRGR
jgi:uncharacterized RDD family membrane protein YckC